MTSWYLNVSLKPMGNTGWPLHSFNGHTPNSPIRYFRSCVVATHTHDTVTQKRKRKKGGKRRKVRTARSSVDGTSASTASNIQRVSVSLHRNLPPIATRHRKWLVRPPFSLCTSTPDLPYDPFRAWSKCSERESSRTNPWRVGLNWLRFWGPWSGRQCPI